MPADLPMRPCIGPNYLNYGTVVAVVYSKPVNQAGAGTPSSYTLDGNNGADSAQIQPNGRVGGPSSISTKASAISFRAYP